MIRKKGLSTTENHKLAKLDKLVEAVSECKILRATIEYINKKNVKPAYRNKS